MANTSLHIWTGSEGRTGAGEGKRRSAKVKRKQMLTVFFLLGRKGTLEKLDIPAAGNKDAQRSKIFIIQPMHERENSREKKQGSPRPLSHKSTKEWYR